MDKGEVMKHKDKQFFTKVKTPKQRAIFILLRDLEILTGYYGERWEYEFEVDGINEKERREIDKHICKFHHRILNMLEKATDKRLK